MPSGAIADSPARKKLGMRFSRVSWLLYCSAAVTNVLGHCMLIVIGIVQHFCTISIRLNPASNIRLAQWYIGVFSSQVLVDIADEGGSKRLLIPGSEFVHDRVEWRTAAVTLGLAIAVSLCSLVCHLAIVFSGRLRTFRVVTADSGLQLAAVVTQILCLASGEIGMKRAAAAPASLNAAAVAQFARSGVPLGPETVTEVTRGFAFWLLVATVFVHLAGLLGEIPYAILLGEALLSDAGRGGVNAEADGGVVIENCPSYPIHCVVSPATIVKDWQTANSQL